MPEKARATFAQRQVGRRLRMYRELAGKTQEDAAEALDCDVSTIYRLESAKTAVNVGHVSALADVYGLARDEKDALVHLVKGSKTRGFTDPYLGAVSQPLSMYGDAERTAVRIEDYCVVVLSGLLQTRQYARQVIWQAKDRDLTTERRQALLSYRMDRQEIFGRPEPPECQFVIHEAALRTQVGSREVMLGQVERLYELDAAPTVSIRFWPCSAGLHEWAAAPFTILHLPDAADPDLVYVENQSEARYLETDRQVSTYMTQLEDMFSRATPIKEFTP